VSDNVDEINDLTFKESRLVHTSLTIVIVTLMFSALPEWSTFFFYMNVVVAAGAISVSVISWKRTELKKRYFSVLSYALLFSLSFIGAQPILRVAWGEGNSLWFYLGAIWVITFFVTTYMRENIFQAFSNTFESRFSISFHIVVLLLILATPIVIVLANMNNLYSQNTQFYLFGALLYICSILLLIMLPAFLKHPKEIMKEEAEKTSRKLI
jgi:hypothetical protein